MKIFEWLFGKKKINQENHKNARSFTVTSARCVTPPVPRIVNPADKNARFKVERSAATDDGFGQSVAMGYLFNDGIIGGVMGGNMAGGMIGDAMNSATSHDPSPSTNDSSPSSYDSGPSADCSPSCDAGTGSFSCD